MRRRHRHHRRHRRRYRRTGIELVLLGILLIVGSFFLYQYAISMVSNYVSDNIYYFLDPFAADEIQQTAQLYKYISYAGFIGGGILIFKWLSEYSYY